MAGDRAGALIALTPDQVIPRYLADEKTADIAASLGVHISALHQWLIRTCEDQWRDAQVARAITQYEAAKEAVSCADDSLCLARATVQLKAAQWELERTYRRVYGGEPTAQNLAQIAVTIDLGGSQITVRGPSVADPQRAALPQSGDPDSD